MLNISISTQCLCGIKLKSITDLTNMQNYAGQKSSFGHWTRWKPTLLHWCSIISFSSFPQLCRKKTHSKQQVLTDWTDKEKPQMREQLCCNPPGRCMTHASVVKCMSHFLKSCAAIAVSVTTGSCNFKKVAETFKKWYKKSNQITQYL
jgi:hypothetical protein